jgi:hypothetical protein
MLTLKRLTSKISNLWIYPFVVNEITVFATKTTRKFFINAVTVTSASRFHFLLYIQEISILIKEDAMIHN